jgi:ABC-2 type transport system ATP-binding protein
MSNSDFVIRTENLSKTYGWWLWKKKIPSLDKLNIEIPRGAVFGFLGPNGAGKTTTIRLLMDLIKPTEGHATVLGKPTDDVEIKHKIGFLPDTPAFSSYLSALEFLTICSKLLKIPASERKRRIAEVLEIVKMTEHAKSKLGGFSRGMIQRIGIAQAILNQPELLILDEPLVGLDPHGRQELKDIISQQRASGTNVFFCSHILSDVERICDHIGILAKGKLLCCGKISELLSETGLTLTIKKGNDEIVKELLHESIGSNRLPDEGWELQFQENEDLKKRINALKEKLPEQITITPTRENLEDFFFRQIENSNNLA